ncbi:MAG: integral rane sensor signal transduction histidine kinase, partial [Frankiales bacterium]|nr:integral rane sensor signal transduction histidine kinase [Frankiales bacterium]
VAAFLVAGLVVLTVVAVVLARAQQRNATAEAIRDARTLTNLEATDVVGPLLNDAALKPGPARDQLDLVVRQRVLGSHIVRVKIWDATGTIVYSDDQQLVGKHFGLGGDELAALRTGKTSAEVTALQAAENQEERQFGKLLQVYQGVKTPEGTRLLFETYQPYSVITVASRRMWQSSLPVLLAGLALLYLVQAPLAYQMARRLRRHQDEREGLLLGTLAASDRERATIAADLHDGVVQGITGASLTLSAGAERARQTDPAVAGAMDSAATDLRRWVRELRSLVVTITPPALHAQGLGPSLIDLAATLELRGLTTSVDVEDAHGLDETTEALLYRAAQEGIRNVVRHADATHVDLTIARSGTEVLLRLRDDGRGLGQQHLDARSRGSVGLELLRQLVSAQGGTLTVTDAEPEGTELVVRLPAGAG